MHALLDQVRPGAVRKDKAAVLASFAPDGVFIDPHYPDPEMRGLKEIGWLHRRPGRTARKQGAEV